MRSLLLFFINELLKVFDGVLQVNGGFREVLFLKENGAYVGEADTLLAVPLVEGVVNVKGFCVAQNGLGEPLVAHVVLERDHG